MNVTITPPAKPPVTTEAAPLWQWSAAALGRAYRDGTLRPSDVVEAILSRIAEFDPALNAFAFLDAEGARLAAKESDRRFAEGRSLGSLDGIPYTAKDNINAAGIPCTWGSKLYQSHVPQKDETPIAIMRAAGAILVGKTTLSEFGRGQGTVNTLAYGITRNPWDPSLTSGSSSGGASAAVAAGFGPIALTTDGGGSTRRPAAYCGLLGMKPTTGRIARLHGLPEMHHDMEVVGQIARTTDDLALLLAAVEGPHPHDRLSLALSGGDRELQVEGLKILYVADFLGRPVDPEISASCAAAADNLRNMGHEVTVGPAPFDIKAFERSKVIMSHAGMTWLMRGQEWKGVIGEEYAETIVSGATFSAVDYMDALTACRDLFIELAECFDAYDLIMMPCCAAMPWAAEEPGPAFHGTFTAFVNSAGIPALSIPGPPSSKGMPIGFQVVAPFAQDWRLIALARAYEQRHPWRSLWQD